MEAVYNPMQAFLECRCTEIDKQPYGLLDKSKVSEHLFVMNGQQFLDGFYFYHNSRIDYQVDAKTIAELHAVIFESDCLLPLYSKPSPFEIAREHCFIYGFEQSGSETCM